MDSSGDGIDPRRQIFAEGLGEGASRMRLRGRRILVVGGGQRTTMDTNPPIGNGRAICQILAREGAAVVCLDRSLEAAQAVCAEIVAAGGNGYTEVADVADAEAIGPALDRAAARLGGLDGLVLNVGITLGLPLGKLTAKDWDFEYAVNVRSHMLFSQRALDVMDAGSSIVIVSSIGAFRPVVESPAYESSKMALIALARSVAKAGQPSGIRCNALLPGIIDTPMGRDEGRRRSGKRGQIVPFGRQGTAWEVAYAALFLLSHEASYVNAQSLSVDGGYHFGIGLPVHGESSRAPD
jgi:NAD(P)-dependent dehydrogenase (short-subunit alcohol dehydrogenase family)